MSNNKKKTSLNKKEASTSWNFNKKELQLSLDTWKSLVRPQKAKKTKGRSKTKLGPPLSLKELSKLPESSDKSEMKELRTLLRKLTSQMRTLE